jgi:hypothetical protein
MPLIGIEYIRVNVYAQSKRYFMGRPKKAPKDLKTVVALRLAPAVKRALQRGAAAESRSVSSFAEQALMTLLKEQGFLK